MSHLVIFGCGYSAEHFLALGEWNGAVSVTVRSPEKVESLRARCIAAHVWSGGEAFPEALREDLHKATHILASIPPDEEGDPVLNMLNAMKEGNPYLSTASWSGLARPSTSLQRLNCSKAIKVVDPRAKPEDDGSGSWAFPHLKNIVYLSTTGVYGDRGGEWIDEDTPPQPTSARGARRLTAEEAWRAFAEQQNASLALLRLSAIYGPGRNALNDVKEGTARRIIKPGQVFNRIHVEDIARAIAAAFARDYDGPLNLADDEPAPPQDVVAFAAELLGMPVPPDLPIEQANLSPMGASFYAENKRVKNERLKALIGSLQFPTYRDGLRALV